MPHLKVEDTPESRSGETWLFAIGKEIRKEGKVTVNLMTGSGVSSCGMCKVRSVSRTLISVDRRQETGHDVILTKNKPQIVDCEDRRDHSAQKQQRHVHIGHVALDSDGPGKGRGARGELLW